MQDFVEKIARFFGEIRRRSLCFFFIANAILRYAVGKKAKEGMKGMKNLLSEKEIKELLGLLDREHRLMIQEIVVCRTPFHALLNKKMGWKFLLYTLKTLAPGICAGSTIFLFPFNLAFIAIKERKFGIPKSGWKTVLAHVLFHEARHVWQRKREHDKYWEAMENYVSGSKNRALYADNWIERDANEFAWRVLTEKRKEIDAIVGA